MVVYRLALVDQPGLPESPRRTGRSRGGLTGCPTGLLDGHSVVVLAQSCFRRPLWTDKLLERHRPAFERCGQHHRGPGGHLRGLTDPSKEVLECQR